MIRSKERLEVILLNKEDIKHLSLEAIGMWTYFSSINYVELLQADGLSSRFNLTLYELDEILNELESANLIQRV